MRVKALKAGYYGNFRKIGDVFEIADPKHLGRWMEPLDPPAPAARQKASKPRRAGLSGETESAVQE